MEIRRYFLILRRWGVILIAALIVSAYAASFFAGQITPTYAAETRIIVGPTFGSEAANLDVVRASQQLVVTYPELVTTEQIMSATLERYQQQTGQPAGLTIQELASAVVVRATEATRLMTIRVTNDDPDRAALLANSIADTLIALNEGAPQAESRLTVIERAIPNDAPVSPNTFAIVVLGSLGGLALASLFMFGYEFLTGQIKTEADVRKVTEAPLLANIVMDRQTGNPFRSSGSGSAIVPEEYQLAGLKLVYAERVKSDTAVELSDQPGRTILVSSPSPSRAIAEVCANLAAAIALTGQSTLLIDGDRRNRYLSRYFSLDQSPGFAEMANDASRWISPRSFRAVPNLFLLPAGEDRVLSTLPLTPANVQVLQRRLASVPIVTIIAGPPVNSTPDGLVLAQCVDSSILLNVVDQTTAVGLQRAVEALGMVGAKLDWTLMSRITLLGHLNRYRFLAGRARRQNATVKAGQESAVEFPVSRGAT
jgi:capsular polysaccharide biosynthesis protein/Mrp family chromosome partitioning ATPase